MNRCKHFFLILGLKEKKQESCRKIHLIAELEGARWSEIKKNKNINYFKGIIVK